MKSKNLRARDRKTPKGNEKRPFFARFLEEQDLSRVAGGTIYQTLKFPSDSDEENDVN